jgi:hypothetical protein
MPDALTAIARPIAACRSAIRPASARAGAVMSALPVAAALIATAFAPVR